MPLANLFPKVLKISNLKMDTQQDTRALFLSEFVKRLILSSLPKGARIERTDVLLEKLEKATTGVPEIKIIKRVEEPVKRIEVRIIPQPIQPEPVITPIIAPKAPEKTGIPIMDRLGPILADPTVISINCPGPDKNITIMRNNGAVQLIAMSFNAADIESFLKDISEKTKIPLLPGLFKVIYQNLIITAVVSEFVGTKFMIEKRMTPALPPMPIKAQFK